MGALKAVWYIMKRIYFINQKNTHSINNACSLASLKNSIAIDENLESKVKDYGIKTLIGDCRNTDKEWDIIIYGIQVLIILLL